MHKFEGSRNLICKEKQCSKSNSINIQYRVRIINAHISSTTAAAIFSSVWVSLASDHRQGERRAGETLLVAITIRGPRFTHLRLKADWFHGRMGRKRAGRWGWVGGGPWLRGVCSDSAGFRHFHLKRFAPKRRLAVGKVSCAPPSCVVGVTLTQELCL